MTKFYRIKMAITVILLMACNRGLVGCSSISRSGTLPPASPAEDSDLSLKEAQSRSRRLSHVAYDLSVTLPADQNTYSGQVQIQFDLSNGREPLRLDFFEGEVQEIKVNGPALPLSAKKKFWIELPATALKVGHNMVDVTFTHEYSHQGQGVHRFVDPENKQVFLYTQFETFDANRFMPCFDQPDLKAVFTLKVDAPANWEVITTTQESSVSSPKDQRRIWQFPPTAAISTYLFSLHAGPFKVWKDRYEDIPLRLFVRPSMAKYVHPADWFTFTKQGLWFYNSFFGFRYPFKKYDQIVVPEFNAGAMENVAAVTFTEGVLSRGQPTRAQRRSLAGIILHEMAHMWFGDIVTMTWWNDLWLNESFATFMSTLTMHQATEFKEAWQTFHSQKNWSYWEDGLVTTHPIEAPVQSVKDAMATFDGITYGKGASVLNQLYHYVSPEKFKAGIRNYIQANAFKNATLQQLMDTLQAQTDKDLNLWSSRWLRQAGPDRVRAQWTCTGDHLREIVLTTKPSNPDVTHTQFRPQAVQLALFEDHHGRLGPATIVPVLLTQTEQTVKGDWSCPGFVYPNHHDDGYLQVSLDDQSLNFAKSHLSGIPDLLLRTMIWGDLWQMVIDADMPLGDYIQIVDHHFAHERDEVLLRQIVATISGGGASILRYWPPTSESSRARFTDFVARFETQFLERLRGSAAGSDLQKFWFDSYVDLARTPKALDQMLKWSRKKNLPMGFTLDLDRQWGLARQLMRFQSPSADRLLVEMKKRDASDRGQKSAMSVDAIQPKLEVKRHWIDILKAPKLTLSFGDARAVFWSLFPFEQKDLAMTFADDYYAYLGANGASEDEILVTSFARALAPLNCEAEGSHRLRDYLASGRKFAPTVQKTLRVSLQEDERCQRIQKLAF